MTPIKICHGNLTLEGSFGDIFRYITFSTSSYRHSSFKTVLILSFNNRQALLQLKKKLETIHTPKTNRLAIE